MKTRPILFSTEMVKAILEGRKTQTRRIVKVSLIAVPLHIDCDIKKCPYGQIGDVLWVRETWAEHAIEDYGIQYKADDIFANVNRWKPSIFMPKKAARIFLKITNIRVERLNDISQIDAIKEGIKRCINYPKVNAWFDYSKYTGFHFINPVSSYSSLWESINGKESWTENPFVWVVEFERTVNPDNPF